MARKGLGIKATGMEPYKRHKREMGPPVAPARLKRRGRTMRRR